VYVTLLPVILAAGLLAALATGALPPGQGALGLVLLLCPGADRFLPILREMRGRGPALAPIAPDLVERLAQELHDADRASTMGAAPQVFVSWSDIPEAAREGRRVQARGLLGAGWKPPAGPAAGHADHLLLGVLILMLGACWHASRHTSELRALQHQAVQRCASEPGTCPAARACAAAAVKASEAWVVVARFREADRASVAKGGQPVNLAQLQDQERIAKDLELQARAACDPANAHSLVNLPDVALPAGADAGVPDAR